MKLTGVFLIETSVVNRGDGIGNIATVKKITTPDGLKVFFSPVSYKRALWSTLQASKGWSLPIVTREGGIVQRTGTIIDSEEFDFGGTMVAKMSKKNKQRYERMATLLVDNGISINNYFGDMEFMTNMAIARMYGENEANIINKEIFYGIYILPFGLEVDRVGVQEISGISVDGLTTEEKIQQIYEALALEDYITPENLQRWSSRIEKIESDGNKTTIVLTKEERKRRIRELLEGMGEVSRRIEGSERNLSPFFAAFSLDFPSPAYYITMKDFLREKLQKGTLDNIARFREELDNKLHEFAQNRNKNILTADYYTYPDVVARIVEQIL